MDVEPLLEIIGSGAIVELGSLRSLHFCTVDHRLLEAVTTDRTSLFATPAVAQLSIGG